MVVVYRMARLSWMIMKRMGYLPWVGLPNILAGRSVVPELLQDKATPEALAEELLRMMCDREKVAAIKQEFADIHRQLRQNAGEKAAQAVLAEIA
jgi:lipid-A-disaccharide synthase